ncbi:MAG: transglutaminase-like domain-containing protein [Rhodospirillales bacterium]
MSTEQIEQSLQTIGVLPDGVIDVAETALLLASLDCPDTGIERYREHLSALAAATAAAAQDVETAPEKISAIGRVLFDEFGYSGDVKTYDDMQNANLIQVIERRKGLPVALGILCLHMGRAQGWQIAGTHFPSHFLLRLNEGRDPLVIDPFHACRIMSEGDLRALVKKMLGRDATFDFRYCNRADNRDVLVRLQNNIKVRAVETGDIGRALEILRRMILIAPEHPGLWFERAVLFSREGQVKAAMATAEAFMALPAAAPYLPRFRALLLALHSQLH